MHPASISDRYDSDFKKYKLVKYKKEEEEEV